MVVGAFISVLAMGLGASPSKRDVVQIHQATYRRKILAADGTALALYRYVPIGGGRSRPAIVLVPELGLSRAAYDFAGQGLARFLWRRGYEVFVPELRGQGRSSHPTEWGLADLVALDLPAVFDAVAELRPEPVDVVAHGYSGALVLAASTTELKGRIRRIVALSTPVEPQVPNPRVEALFERGGRFSDEAWLPEGRNALALVLSHGHEHSSPRIQALYTGGMSNLSRTAARELLGWVRRGDLLLADGSSVRGRLAQFDRPTLLVLAMANNFAHPEFASPLRELSPAPITVRMLSRLEFLGEDYTHLSMLHGENAESDLFGPIVGYLKRPTAAP